MYYSLVLYFPVGFRSVDRIFRRLLVDFSVNWSVIRSVILLVCGAAEAVFLEPLRRMLGREFFSVGFRPVGIEIILTTKLLRLGVCPLPVFRDRSINGSFGGCM